VWSPSRPVELEATLGPLALGAYDPAVRRDSRGAYWRASRTPEGASTTRFARTPDGIAIESFGPGAAWALDNAPDLLGASDDPSGFAPTGKLATLHRRHPGLRITRTKAVYEACVRAICGQLVTGREAMRTFAQLARKWGERAPGPFELALPPSPERLAVLPTWELQSLGLGTKRALALREVAARAVALEETSTLALDEAYARLLAIEGVGPWTAAEVAVVAWGDADAVSVGDYHLKNTVVFAFTGEPRGTDAQMTALLAPYRPHRARVIKLIEAAGIHAPRFGPRRPIRRP
jgi:3-methyladenine DNA glycosylase/8-oxoguanine DNA glycosylase